MSRTSWWARKARQLLAHVTASVSDAERAAAAAWLTAPELALFDAMHVADRRHGLDVVGALRRSGIRDRDVLAAGVLHDCAKGDTGFGPRVAWSLGEAFGPWAVRLARAVPGWSAALDRLASHADASADLCASAGLPSFAVDLVRHQADPRDPRYGEPFRAADEAC